MPELKINKPFEDIVTRVGWNSSFDDEFAHSWIRRFDSRGYKVLRKPIVPTLEAKTSLRNGFGSAAMERVTCSKSPHLWLGYSKTTAFAKNHKKPPLLWQVSHKVHWFGTEQRLIAKLIGLAHLSDWAGKKESHADILSQAEAGLCSVRSVLC